MPPIGNIRFSDAVDELNEFRVQIEIDGVVDIFAEMVFVGLLLGRFVGKSKFHLANKIQPVIEL